MAWPDRLVEAAYTSPSGQRIVWLYENVSRAFEKLTTAYEFPNVAGSFVQDLGRSGHRFPLRVIFSGGNYDLQADIFDAMLEEQGVGTLEHPLYGTFRVVPFGTITRRDDLKTAGNQAIFDLTFFETNEIVFPVAGVSAATATASAVAAFEAAGPIELALFVELELPEEDAAFKSRFKAALNATRDGIRSVSRQAAEVQRRVDRVYNSTINAIDTGIGTPLTLATQAVIMTQLPARAFALITDKFKAYGNLLTALVNPENVGTPSLDSQPQNQFRNDDLYASNYLVAMVSSALETQFELKGDALAAADSLLTFEEQWIVWRDANLEALNVIDPGEMYQQAHEAVSFAAGFLVEISFSLKQERSLVLDRPRTPIDLEAHLYGTVDVNLDLLILSNDLAGLDILEVPAGRSVVYYR